MASSEPIIPCPFCVEKFDVDGLELHINHVHANEIAPQRVRQGINIDPISTRADVEFDQVLLTPIPVIEIPFRKGFTTAELMFFQRQAVDYNDPRMNVNRITFKFRPSPPRNLRELERLRKEKEKQEIRKKDEEALQRRADTWVATFLQNSSRSEPELLEDLESEEAYCIGKQREDPSMSTSTVQRSFDVIKTSSSGISEPTLPKDLRNENEETKGKDKLIRYPLLRRPRDQERHNDAIEDEDIVDLSPAKRTKMDGNDPYKNMEREIEQELEDEQMSEIRILENSEEASLSSEDSVDEEDLSIPIEIIKKRSFNERIFYKVLFQHQNDVHTSWIPKDALESVNNNLIMEFEEKIVGTKPTEETTTTTTTTTTTQPEPVEEIYSILPKYSTVITLTDSERLKIDTEWNDLELNLAKILTKLGHIEMKWDDIWGTMYRQVFQLKTWTKGNELVREELYTKFKNLFIDHVISQKQEISNFTGLLETEAESIVRLYLKLWADYAIASKYIQDIFSMHYFWVPNEKGVPDIFTLALRTWTEKMFLPIKGLLIEAILFLINQERNLGQKVVDNTLVSSLIQSIIVIDPKEGTPLDLFLEHFLNPYVEDAKQFYTVESNKNISQCGVTFFMEKVESRLLEEQERIKSFAACASSSSRELKSVYHALLASCWTVCESMTNLETSFEDALHKLNTSLFDILHIIMISNYEETLISALPQLLIDGQWEHISRMYRLQALVKRTSNMEAIIELHLLSVGGSLIDSFVSTQNVDRSKAVEFVNKMYNWVTHYRAGFKAAFGDSVSLKILLEKSITSLLNKNYKFSRYVCQFMDSQLRSSGERGGENRFEEQCNLFIDLSKYLNDKDLLQKYFTLDLAVRLLDRSQCLLENEKYMLAKLKEEHGLSFTSNMERMFKDITLSQDIAVEFENFRKPVVASKNDSKLQMSPIVVSNGCWPTSIVLRGFEVENTTMDFSAMALECLLPPCVEAIWNTFKSFYLGQYQGRKLTFISHLGSAEMAFYASSKTFFLQTTTNMMPILMLFNKYDKLSYSEIKAETNIPDRYLRAALYSLCHTKYAKNCTDKILKKSPDSKDIAETDEFWINAKFTCKMKKIKLRLVNPNKESQIIADTEDNTLKEREMLCDACIVRIMKSRKTLTHTQLLKEVVLQLSPRFQAQPQLIKKRIQGLIDREFLARSPTDITTYHYVA